MVPLPPGGRLCFTHDVRKTRAEPRGISIIHYSLFIIHHSFPAHSSAFVGTGGLTAVRSRSGSELLKTGGASPSPTQAPTFFCVHSGMFVGVDASATTLTPLRYSTVLKYKIQCDDRSYINVRTGRGGACSSRIAPQPRCNSGFLCKNIASAS